MDEVKCKCWVGRELRRHPQNNPEEYKFLHDYGCPKRHSSMPTLSSEERVRRARRRECDRLGIPYKWEGVQD